MKRIIAIVFILGLLFYGFNRASASDVTLGEGMMYGAVIGVGIGGIIELVKYLLKEKPGEKIEGIPEREVIVKGEEDVEEIGEETEEILVQSEEIEEVPEEEEVEEKKYFHKFSPEGSIETLTGRFSIGGHLGYGFFAMDDVNKGIDEGNDELRAMGFYVLNSEKFTGGFVGDFEIRYAFLEELMLGLGFGYIRSDADNEYSYRAQSIILEGEVSIFPIFMNLYYYKYFKSGMNLYGGAGFSYLAGGRLLFSSYGEESEAKGDGTGFQITGGLEYLTGNHLSIGAEIMYRYAVVPEIRDTLDNAILVNSDGTKTTLDFSGLNFLGSIRIYF